MRVQKIVIPNGDYGVKYRVLVSYCRRFYRAIDGKLMYACGDDGSGWSYHPYRNPQWKKMQPSRVGRDEKYLGIKLCNNGKSKKIRMHAFVLEAFKGKAPPGCQCRHRNGKHTDNRLCNLYWGTPAQDYADMRRHGTAPIGVRNGSCKLTLQQVKDIKYLLAAGDSVNSIARAYGISHSNVSMIKSGITWKEVEIQTQNCA